MRVGKVAHVKIDQLLEQQVVKRRHPVQLVRGDTKIDRHGVHPQCAKVKFACFSGGIDARVEPKTELGRYGLDDAGEGVFGA